MARFTATTLCSCQECGWVVAPNKFHACCGEAERLHEAVEDLLKNLGWATQPDNPDGLFIRAVLFLLRRSIQNTYKALGFTDEELKGFLFR